MKCSKKIISIFLLITILVSFSVSAGNISVNDITVGNTEQIYDIITRISCHWANAFMQDGKPYLIVAPGGGKVFIIDIIEEKLYKEFYFPGLDDPAMVSAVDPTTGDVYVGGISAGGTIYRYSVTTKNMESLNMAAGLGINAIMSMDFDEEGNLYMGGFPLGKAFKYDVKKNTFEDYGIIYDQPAQHCYTAYYKGTLYCGTNSEKDKLKKIDIKTGSVTEIETPKEIGEYSSPKKPQNLDDKHLLVPYASGDTYQGTAKYYFAIYDLETGKWLDVVEDVDSWSYSPPLDNKIYYVNKRHELCEYNLVTKNERILRSNTPISMIRGADVLIDYPEEGFPGKSIVSWAFAGSFFIINTENGNMKEIMVEDEIVRGIPSPMQLSIEVSPDGKVYCGEEQGLKAFEYDMVSKKAKIFQMGEPSGIGKVGDKVYFSCYPGANIYVLDTLKPYNRFVDYSSKGSNPLFWGQLGYNQNRGNKIIDAGGKVVIGSYSTVSYGGGALSIYDPKKDTMDVYKDIVKDKTPIAMTYKDGLLYVGFSATTEGGLNNHSETWDPNSTIAVFDMNTKKIIRQKDVSVPGFDSPVTIIKSMTMGDDGLLWCSFDGLVFAVDPVTLETVKSKIVGHINTYYKGVEQIKPDDLQFDKKTGLLFLSYPGTVIDTKTMEYKPLGLDYMKLGADGNLYGIRKSGDKAQTGGFLRTIVKRGSNDLSTLNINNAIIKVGSNKIVSNGYTREFKTNIPYIKNERIMVPMEEISNILGFDFKKNVLGYTASNKEKNVTFKQNEKKVRATSNKINMDGSSNYDIDILTKNNFSNANIYLGVAPEMKNNDLCVPIRVLLETLGKHIHYKDGFVVISDSENIDNSIFTYAESVFK